jgi:hypothetical protein
MWCQGGHLHKECPEMDNMTSILTCCNCKLVDGEEPHPSNYRGCRHDKEEIGKRKSQTAPEKTTGRLFSSSHTAPGLPFAVVLHSNSSCLSRPQLQRPAPSQWEKWMSPIAWGTTNNKYQVSQFRFILQTDRLWTTCSKYSQRYFIHWILLR